MPTEKDIQAIKQLLDIAENNIRQAKNLLFEKECLEKAKSLNSDEANMVIEGIFDGEKMIGQNEKAYQIPSNYASKSKLVTGDVLKLTIREDGSYIFKQIGPVERKKIIGELEEITNGRYIVRSGNLEFRVLPASVTYFRAKKGDTLTVLVPEDGASEWAAVENIV